MKITVNKCDQCGAIIEDEVAYQKHVENHAKLALLEGAFPQVKDDRCEFANGGWCVRRHAEWLAQYKAKVEELVGPMKYEPGTYGWFRELNDSGSPFYSVACRIWNVCPVCFREWGQPYYANHCNHTAPGR